MPQLLPAVSNFFIGAFTAAGVSGTTAVAWSTAVTGFLKAVVINTVISSAMHAIGTHGEDDDGTTWQAVDYDA